MVCGSEGSPQHLPAVVECGRKNEAVGSEGAVWIPRAEEHFQSYLLFLRQSLSI